RRRWPCVWRTKPVSHLRQSLVVTASKSIRTRTGSCRLEHPRHRTPPEAGRTRSKIRLALWLRSIQTARGLGKGCDLDRPGFRAFLLQGSEASDQVTPKRRQFRAAARLAAGLGLGHGRPKYSIELCDEIPCALVGHVHGAAGG